MRVNRMRLIWIVLLAAVLGRSGFAEPQLINGVAVIVNDAIITYQDVRQFVGPQLELLERQFGDQPQVLRQRQSKLLKDGTDQLVERQLILHDFKTAGYNLPESIIEDTIRDRTKQRFGDRITLARTLKAEGVTLETYRTRTREEIIIEQMRYFHVSKELIISPQKIANYYEANKTNYSVADQVKLRMIVLNKPPGGDNGATKELATEILGKVKGGASFEEMARIHSEGSQRAVGGDWGWVERSVLRKELADVAFGLKKGVTSEVLDLPEACFIMLVEDLRPAHVKPLLEVRDDIEKNLVMQERARLQEKWIDRLREKSFIRYF
jgi:peptidyl-prolyl cis-trans isomerase SurA